MALTLRVLRLQCQNGKVPYSILTNTLATSFTGCGAPYVNGADSGINPNSVCQSDTSGQSYCNSCNSCTGATSCNTDADCGANYACIVNSACSVNGTVGAAVCLYMLFDANSVANGCYSPY